MFDPFSLLIPLLAPIVLCVWPFFVTVVMFLDRRDKYDVVKFKMGPLKTTILYAIYLYVAYRYFAPQFTEVWNIALYTVLFGTMAFGCTVGLIFTITESGKVEAFHIFDR